PSLRVESAVVPLMEAPLDGEEIAAAILPALPPHALQAYRDGGIADASYHARDLGRFRITLHRERGRAAPLFAGCRPLFHDWRHWACRHLWTRSPIITITRKQGSFTLEESLTDLVKQALVDRKDAIARAIHPEELERLLA